MFAIFTLRMEAKRNRVPEWKVRWMESRREEEHLQNEAQGGRVAVWPERTLPSPHILQPTENAFHHAIRHSTHQPEEKREKPASSIEFKQGVLTVGPV